MIKFWGLLAAAIATCLLAVQTGIAQEQAPGATAAGGMPGSGRRHSPSRTEHGGSSTLRSNCGRPTIPSGRTS